MERLSLSNINSNSYYTVWEENGNFFFRTDFGITYTVAFERDAYLPNDFYWFRLTNRSGAKSPGDANIPQTLVCIIMEFFASNPSVLLYICDSANEQQAQRNRLFLSWFNRYDSGRSFLMRTATIVDEGEENYVAIILQRDNPLKSEILSRFDSEIAMLQRHK